MLQSRISQNIFITLLIIIVSLLLVWGLWNSVRTAKSKAILKDAHAITQGFSYFYSDQNRYPTALEFADANVMRAYISNYPPQDFSGGACPKTFDYVNPSSKRYELRICLPKGVDGFRNGWNVIKSPQ